MQELNRVIGSADLLEAQITDLQNILAMTDQGILLLSVDDKIEFVNPAYFEIMGIAWSERKLIGNLMELRQAFRSKSLYSKKLNSSRKWNEFLTYLDTHNSAAIENQQTISMGDRVIKFIRRPFAKNRTLECVYDITDLAQKQTQLILEKEKAKVAYRAKSEFLANMSHEIRTPMNGILGMTELLSNRELGSQDEKLLGVIQRSGNALLTIINDILDFSKIESGQMTLSPEPFNLKECIVDVLELLGCSRKRKNINLLFQFQSNLPDCYLGDVGRLRQIITNILGNALKFTEEGRILVKVTGQVVNKIGRLSFRFEDTGIGIPPEKITTIFKEFQQADGSTTRKYGGTGLGLSIAKSFVELMGGRLEVESQVGKGSVFFFSIDLPVSDSQKLQEVGKLEPMKLQSPQSLETASELIVESEAKSLDQYKQYSPENLIDILIAEDNEVNQAHIAFVLEGLNFTYHIVENGKKALEVWKEKHPKIILMDISMPEMNGYQATKAIRKFENDHALKRIPIIAVTAHAMENVQQLCLDHDMDDLLLKPWLIKQLLTILKKWQVT